MNKHQIRTTEAAIDVIFYAVVLGICIAMFADFAASAFDAWLGVR